MSDEESSRIGIAVERKWLICVARPFMATPPGAEGNTCPNDPQCEQIVMGPIIAIGFARKPTALRAAGSLARAITRFNKDLRDRAASEALGG